MELGRFYIETETFKTDTPEDAIMFRARGIYGMKGGWHEDEGETYLDLAEMMRNSKLDKGEQEAYDLLCRKIVDEQLIQKRAIRIANIKAEMELCKAGYELAGAKPPGTYTVKCPRCGKQAEIRVKEGGYTSGRCKSCGAQYGEW